MEIYHCLNDIITDVEKKNNAILLARSCDGLLIIIDLYKLQDNFRLEGAEVFKMLFGISHNNPFGKFPMGKDKEGCITILKDLSITSRHWYLFTLFLYTGSVPGYDDYILGKEYKFNELSFNIQKLQEMCIKVGGVPSFDLFRDNFYKGEFEKKTIIDPKNPEEDHKNKYQWRRIRATGPHISAPPAHYGWSCASTSSVKEGNHSYAYHNYRRDWNFGSTNVINEEELDLVIDEYDDPSEQIFEYSDNNTGQPDIPPAHGH